jgi:dihydroxy-acid dehydratase
LQLNVDKAEIERRSNQWEKPALRYPRGVLAGFARNAAKAGRGAGLDDLED